MSIVLAIRVDLRACVVFVQMFSEEIREMSANICWTALRAYDDDDVENVEPLS